MGMGAVDFFRQRAGAAVVDDVGGQPCALLDDFRQGEVLDAPEIHRRGQLLGLGVHRAQRGDAYGHDPPGLALAELFVELHQRVDQGVLIQGIVPAVLLGDDPSLQVGQDAAEQIPFDQHPHDQRGIGGQIQDDRLPAEGGVRLGGGIGVLLDDVAGDQVGYDIAKGGLCQMHASGQVCPGDGLSRADEAQGQCAILFFYIREVGSVQCRHRFSSFLWRRQAGHPPFLTIIHDL